ncbi:MAG TPA: hypothetical protein VN693_04250 [Rhodanobacteraceae bacterium]|nr:hypothetical protein [Rhodanobacteraceae bacterium]
MSSRHFPRTVSVFALAIAAAVASSAAAAQQSPALDRVSVWLGGYYSSNDTTVTAQGTGNYAGIEGKLNFEDDLGLKQHSVDPRARLDFLIGDSQGFSFDYYQIHRDLDASYEQPIPALGTDVGASLHSDVDYDFGSASYKWWFGHASDVFGIGLGAAYYKVDFRVDGNAHAGEQGTTFSDSYDESAWAPMLTLGWRHAFDEHWRMYADVAGIEKNGGDLSGHIWNGALGVEWFPWQNVGFALEYSASRLHLDKEFDDASAKLDLDSDGPAFYLRARF